MEKDNKASANRQLDLFLRSALGISSLEDNKLTVYPELASLKIEEAIASVSNLGMQSIKDAEISPDRVKAIAADLIVMESLKSQKEYSPISHTKLFSSAIFHPELHYLREMIKRRNSEHALKIARISQIIGFVKGFTVASVFFISGILFWYFVL